MKWLAGGLTFVNVATVSAVLLGMVAGGLRSWIAHVAVLLGVGVAALAFFSTGDGHEKSANAPAAEEPSPTYRHIWFWILAACFGFFAYRSFCWLLFAEGNHLMVQSPNNLGDLSLHLAYIKNFASGVALWPDNPIHAFSKLRYPAGTDIFNAVLLLLGFDLTRGLIWAGLAGSLASFYALYRWGGVFTVAGFLFNGGLAGFQVYQSFKWIDYQGVSTIAWKSLPLSMLVTQRGLLYALPAGLLLLFHWRAKFYPRANEAAAERDPSPPRAILPFWVEFSLFATMPLFHLHTFMALSIVAAFLFVISTGAQRRHFPFLVAAAVVPATFFVWTITDHFQARSLLQWKPGWVQAAGDFASPFFKFWIWNFGLFLPLCLGLIGVCLWRVRQSRTRFSFDAHPALAFVAPACLIFLFACLIKTAPWEWDNIKLIIWAYLIVLPFLWSELIAGWSLPVRAGICAALFSSGFVSLYGGLAANRNGHNIAERAELDGVGAAVRKLPVEARFAAFPTYNHPLLLQGRKVVLGYPGHLWTQGFNYADPEKKLNALMEGAPNWRDLARELRVRYLFWGREEKAKYGASLRPWEREAPVVGSGGWGAIYDLEPGPPAP